MAVVGYRRVQLDLARGMRRHGVRPMRPLAYTLLLRIQQGLNLGDGIFLADVLDRRIKNIRFA